MEGSAVEGAEGSAAGGAVSVGEAAGDEQEKRWKRRVLPNASQP
jgi:hypothetical protein